MSINSLLFEGELAVSNLWHLQLGDPNELFISWEKEKEKADVNERTMMEDPESHALHALEMKEASHAWIPLPNDIAWNMDTEMMIHVGWQWMVHYMHCMLCPTFGVFWLLIFSSCKSKHRAINYNCKTFFFQEWLSLYICIWICIHFSTI